MHSLMPFIAFMASGSSPGRGPYGASLDKALAYVMQNTSPAGFIAGTDGYMLRTQLQFMF